MEKDNYIVHDCLIFLLIAVVICIGVAIIGFGGLKMSNCEDNIAKVILVIVLIAIMLVLVLFGIKLFAPENKDEFFVVNNETIKDKTLVNSQKRIAVDMDIAKIPPRYFSGNNTLEELEIFIGTEAPFVIEESAFFACSKLKTIKISGGTVDIKPNAFSGCKKLEEIIYDRKLEDFKKEYPSFSTDLPKGCLIKASDHTDGIRVFAIK